MRINKGLFPLRAWNEVFFVSLIDFLFSTRKAIFYFLRALALSETKKSIKQTKYNPFHARSGNGPYDLENLNVVIVNFKTLQ